MCLPVFRMKWLISVFRSVLTCSMSVLLTRQKVRLKFCSRVLHRVIVPRFFSVFSFIPIPVFRVGLTFCVVLCFCGIVYWVNGVGEPVLRLQVCLP